MFEAYPVLTIGLISIVAILIYLFFWRAVAELSVPMKVAARVLLTVVLILPLGLAFWASEYNQFETVGSAPPPTESKITAREDRAETRSMAPSEIDADDEQPVSRSPAAKKAEKPKRAKQKVADRAESELTPTEPTPEPQPPAPAAPKGGIPRGVAPYIPPVALPDTSLPEIVLPDITPPPDIILPDITPPPEPLVAPRTAPPKATEPAAANEEAPTSGAEIAGAQPPPAAAPAAEKPDWTVVPVYYGTDREHKPGTERLDYDWKRARRLELGRALVTIPKVHVIPMVERPWAIRIPYVNITIYESAEDPEKHFTMQELKALSREDFLKLVREKISNATRFKDHALIFVHGYQTHFDNAVFRTAQIAYDLKFDSAPFLYSWPSGGTLQGYTYDRESASQAEPFLRDFLELVTKQSSATKVSVIAHSMGNQLLLRVLQDLKRSTPEGVTIDQLILAAPDVDRHNFENIIKSIQGIANGITLYTAANDTALQVSRRINGGIARAGDVPESGPIVMEGMDTIDATASSMDSIGINHSGYAENNALLTDIGLLIKTGQRPPDKRVPTLELRTTENGNYWKYPEPQD